MNRRDVFAERNASFAAEEAKYRISPGDALMLHQNAKLAEYMTEIGAYVEQLAEEQRKTQMHLADVIFIKNRHSAEAVLDSSQQLTEENRRLEEENTELKSLLRNHMPNIQLFRTAAMIFALCAISFLGWLWLNIELVHPVFALLGMPASIGFMIMARIAGRLKENREETKTPQIEGVLDELRLMKISIPEPAAVKDYLLRYPDIGRVLPSLCKITSERFEMPAQLSLEVYEDSEIDDEDLTLYVRQEDYDDQIMDIIEEIRTEYYKLLTGKSGWLHLTTDFRPPKSRR